jgi:hypothetical protein
MSWRISNECVRTYATFTLYTNTRSSSSGSDSSDSDSSSDDDTAKPILGARSRTQSPPRRDPEPDSLLTLAPSAPATAPKPAAPAAPTAQVKDWQLS